MTLAELCSVTYVLAAEAVERDAAAHVTGAFVARALGAEGDMPSVAGARADWDRWLRSEPPPPRSDDEMALRRALGLE